MGKRSRSYFRIGLSLLLLANAWDAIVTSWSLTHNISTELNPLLQFVHAKYGIWGLISSKLLIVFCVVILVFAGYNYARLRAQKRLKIFTLITFLGALAFFIAGLSWFFI